MLILLNGVWTPFELFSVSEGMLMPVTATLKFGVLGISNLKLSGDRRFWFVDNVAICAEPLVDSPIFIPVQKWYVESIKGTLTVFVILLLKRKWGKGMLTLSTANGLIVSSKGYDDV